jgi:hypothetical protein
VRPSPAAGKCGTILLTQGSRAMRPEKLTYSDRLAIVLACLAGVMAIVLFLTEKTLASVVALVALMYGFSIYPVFHFVRRKLSRILGLFVVAVGMFLFSWKEWPELPITAIWITNFEQLPIILGKTTGLNLTAKVSGTGDGDLENDAGSFFDEAYNDDAKQLELEEKLWQEIERQINVGTPHHRPYHISLPFENILTTIGTGEITSDQLQKLQSGKYGIYYLGRMIFTARSGKTSRDYCVYFRYQQAMRLCNRHN